MRTLFLRTILFLVFCAGVVRAQSAAEHISLRSFDGRSAPAELTHLTVPADRLHPARKFDLAFYRLSVSDKGVPIVFLMGGPGVSATFIAQVPPYFDLFTRLARQAPVILLDQRGTGLSTPKVDCPAGFKPSSDLFTTPQVLLETHIKSYAACADYWSARGVFPDDFSVEEVADDVEAVRQTIGVPQIDLLALSFGTRIALEVVRRHPHSVRQIVLQGTVTPDGLVRLPLEMDAFFRRTAEQAKSQAAAKGLNPDLTSALHEVEDHLRQNPMPVAIKTLDDREINVAIGVAMFTSLVATHTADARLPALLTSMARGDPSIVAPILQSIYQDLEQGDGSLMAHSIPCTATDAKARGEIAQAQAPKSLVGQPFDNAMVAADFCIAIHAHPVSSRTPRISGTMPVLFINGDLDDRTPVSLTESARKGFPHSRLILVRNGGHELLPEEAVQSVVADFFAGTAEKTINFGMSPIEFLSVAEAAHPPHRPH